MVYLDNAATTYPKPQFVYEEMDRVNRELAFNAGRGSYSSAREATRIIDETRQLILDLVSGSGLEKVILTSSATEALNIILQGIEFEKGDIVYISPYEHNAVARVLKIVEERIGIEVKLLPLKENSYEIDIEKTQYFFIKDKPKSVCCTHVSNVTGYILPVNIIFQYAHDIGAITVLDASQSLGLLDININEIGADFVAFAGHKTLYGPFGVGGFIDTKSIQLAVSFAGGTGSDSLDLHMPSNSPERYEASSKNIIAIAGLRASLLKLDTSVLLLHERELTNLLIDGLKEVPGIVLYMYDDQEKMAGIVSFNIKDYSAEEIGDILSDEYDIAVRTGYHCAPYVHDAIKDKDYLGTVRVSVGQFTSKEDIYALIEALKQIVME